MHARQPTPPALLRPASFQGGVVSREQVLGCGLGRHAIDRLVADGRWVRVANGLYLTAGGTPSWASWAWAGVLAGGDRARLGGRAAAHGWGLCTEEPAEICVLVPNEGSAPRIEGPWHFVRERAGVRSPRNSGNPARAQLDDVAVDLASGAESAEVVTWLSAAVGTRRTTPERLLAVARRRHRLRHRTVIEAVLGDLAAGAHSALEIAYLRDVERAHGLPRAERQVRRGRTWADAFYREFSLLVELDGRLGHSGVGHFRDMQRDNAATSEGLATLRFGWPDVHGRACEVAFQVGHNLGLRGWAGRPTRCDRCRRAA